MSVQTAVMFAGGAERSSSRQVREEAELPRLTECHENHLKFSLKLFIRGGGVFFLFFCPSILNLLGLSNQHFGQNKQFSTIYSDIKREKQ